MHLADGSGSICATGSGISVTIRYIWVDRAVLRSKRRSPVPIGRLTGQVISKGNELKCNVKIHPDLEGEEGFKPRLRSFWPGTLPATARESLLLFAMMMMMVVMVVMKMLMICRIDRQPYIIYKKMTHFTNINR